MSEDITLFGAKRCRVAYDRVDTERRKILIRILNGIIDQAIGTGKVKNGNTIIFTSTHVNNMLRALHKNVTKFKYDEIRKVFDDSDWDLNIIPENAREPYETYQLIF